MPECAQKSARTPAFFIFWSQSFYTVGFFYFTEGGNL